MVTKNYLNHTYLPTYLSNSSDSCDSCDSNDSSESSDSSDSSDGGNSSDSSDQYFFFYRKTFFTKKLFSQ